MRWLEEKEQGRAWRSYGRALHGAAASLLLTLDGVPMLLMGQEFEEPGWQSWETLFEPFALGPGAWVVEEELSTNDLKHRFSLHLQVEGRNNGDFLARPDGLPLRTP